MTGSRVGAAPEAPYRSQYWMPAMKLCQKRLIGDYWLEECDQHKLGEGAFGMVYRAEHIHSGIPVAVKKLAKEKVKFDELKAVSKLNNENVISIIDLHTNDEAGQQQADACVFVILELCDTDLHAHLRNQEHGRLSPADLDLITESLARGYIALYEKSIIHRDIKPENILLKYACSGRVRAAKIGDFGASRLMGSEEETRKLTSLAGTPLYMAPEIGANIVADRQYDAKVDMWSVGVVLYECINGQVPFDERALCRLFLFSANANYEGYLGPPSPWISSASLCYRALVTRLLELDASQRLGPQEFFCWVVHQKLLIDETAVIEINGQTDVTVPNGKRRLFKLRDSNGCCTGAGISVMDGRNAGVLSNQAIENNNNEAPEYGNCNRYHDHRFTGSYSNGVIVKRGKSGIYADGSALSYAIERCIWFSGMFVACNYCCFSLRQYDT